LQEVAVAQQLRVGICEGTHCIGITCTVTQEQLWDTAAAVGNIRAAASKHRLAEVLQVQQRFIALAPATM
jgi:hypothetical protein